MKLTKESIQDWKPLFDAAAIRAGLTVEPHNYSDTLEDDEWIDRYEGQTPEEAVNEEIENIQD